MRCTPRSRSRGGSAAASAIVGALAAANALIGSPLADDELFQMATALEKHPDNVGASLFGGSSSPSGTGRGRSMSASSPTIGWKCWWPSRTSSCRRRRRGTSCRASKASRMPSSTSGIPRCWWPPSARGGST
ncbi:hypothetical protein LJK88_12455 [Paenibacillus sp. P26]|nr:hypothetical protein LJK88_12455 [Paenibacillus sp. P26]